MSGLYSVLEPLPVTLSGLYDIGIVDNDIDNSQFDNFKSDWIFKRWVESNGLSLYCSEAALRKCSAKRVFLEILQSSQENTCARASFLIKLQDSVLELY